MKWEYVTLSTDLNQFEYVEENLNELGAHGWEAVGFTTSDRTGSGPAAYRVILKRPID